MKLARIEHLLVGTAAPFTRPGSQSAIGKQPVAGPLYADSQGLQGDEQGDRKVHGGIHKALHHYPYDHYRRWSEQIGPRALLGQPGAFGENISTLGLTEADLCLGDVLRCGNVMLEVVQTRQPCWKLNDRFDVPDMSLRMQDSGTTGWYYRVLEPGYLEAGQPLLLEHRPFPRWPLPRVIDLLYRHPLDQAALRELRGLPLVPNWRDLVEKRLELGVVEDWNKRLYGVPES